MNKICVHSIVRYEPFIVYAIESVIDHVDQVLLYDLGSRNAKFEDYTIQDCEMLAKKYSDKIVFREIETTDETPWSTSKYNKFRKYMRGKKCKGEIRKQQIQDTSIEYKYFMVVDGDEIYHKDTISKIKNELTQDDWGGIQDIRVPIRWFYDLDQYFEGHGANTSTGRIYLRDRTDMLVSSPGELHISKDTNRPFSYDDGNMKVADLPHMTHWEAYLKRWRRDVPAEALKARERDLPEVMQEFPEYIERYETQMRGSREEYFSKKQRELGL